jgi:hypothetical protein
MDRHGAIFERSQSSSHQAGHIARRNYSGISSMSVRLGSESCEISVVPTR